jgi:hypothetical protein
LPPSAAAAAAASSSLPASLAPSKLPPLMLMLRLLLSNSGIEKYQPRPQDATTHARKRPRSVPGRNM